MRAKGYSDEESKDKTLQMQVRREIEKFKGWDPPRPPEAAAEAATMLLALSAPSNTTNRRAIATITPALPAAASIAASAAFLDEILLPWLPRKTKLTSHQKQINHHAQTRKRQEAIAMANTSG